MKQAHGEGKKGSTTRVRGEKQKKANSKLGSREGVAAFVRLLGGGDGQPSSSSRNHIIYSWVAPRRRNRSSVDSIIIIIIVTNLERHGRRIRIGMFESQCHPWRRVGFAQRETNFMFRRDFQMRIDIGNSNSSHGGCGYVGSPARFTDLLASFLWMGLNNPSTAQSMVLVVDSSSSKGRVGKPSVVDRRRDSRYERRRRNAKRRLAFSNNYNDDDETAKQATGKGMDDPIFDDPHLTCTLSKAYVNAMIQPVLYLNESQKSSNSQAPLNSKEVSLFAIF
jgi:hypothetical protein